MNLDDYRAASVEQQLSARLAHAAAEVRLAPGQWLETPVVIAKRSPRVYTKGGGGVCQFCPWDTLCRTMVKRWDGSYIACEAPLPRELLLQPRTKRRGGARVRGG